MNEKYEDEVRLQAYLFWKQRTDPNNHQPYPSFADAAWDWKQGEIIVGLMRNNLQ